MEGKPSNFKSACKTYNYIDATLSQEMEADQQIFSPCNLHILKKWIEKPADILGLLSLIRSSTEHYRSELFLRLFHEKYIIDEIWSNASYEETVQLERFLKEDLKRGNRSCEFISWTNFLSRTGEPLLKNQGDGEPIDVNRFSTTQKAKPISTHSLGMHFFKLVKGDSNDPTRLITERFHMNEYSPAMSWEITEEFVAKGPSG